MHSAKSTTSARWIVVVALIAVMVLMAGLLAACGKKEKGLESADLPDKPTVLKDEIATTQALLKTAEGAVVSSESEAAQRRAAAIAVAAGMPMLVIADPKAAEEEEAEEDFETLAQPPVSAAVESGAPVADVHKELDRLGAGTVITVGTNEIKGTDQRTVIADPGKNAALAELIGVDMANADSNEKDAAKAIAEMDAKKPSAPELEPTGAPAENGVEITLPEISVGENDKAKALVSEESPLATIATARAAGIPLEWVTVSDPRATSGSLEAVRKEGDLIALGSAFGSQENFDKAVELAKDESIQELPGGGTLLFANRHIIATYGHPGVAPLGVMGEDDPAGAVKRVNGYVEEYKKHVDGDVIPGFEIIASVAQADPGPRGDYSAPSDPETLIPYIDAITEAGGYAILDLQPGSADFVEQAKLYEELLKRPNVGLALDSEWKMQPGEVPATVVGHVEAEEVNRVADWLAELTRKNKLPQKMLMLHQFQLQMIRSRENVDLSHPELAYVLHADGHGTAEEKFATWNVLHKDLQPEFVEAWKNFIDEDQPMFTPEQTMDIKPQPKVVTYQ